MNRSRVLSLIAAGAAVAALVAAAGCGERKEQATGSGGTRSVDVILDFFPNADHVGLYAALSRGYFKSEGLDVHPHAPSDPAAPLKLLAAGRADFAISYEPELLLARDRGLKVASVAAIVQRPLTSIVAIRAKHIRTPADLQGKRVGTAGIPYQSAYLHTIAKHAGIDPGSIKETNVGFNLVPAMLSKKVDATLGSFWNYEGIQLRQRHKRPTVIPVDRAGVPSYDELIVVAREDTLRKDGELVRRFLRGLDEGYRAARRDPTGAVNALLADNHDLDRRLQLASVRATLPAFFPRAGHPWGYQDLRRWSKYASWMLDNHLVKHPPNVSRAATNEFLAGQGI